MREPSPQEREEVKGGTTCHHVPAYLEPIYLAKWEDGRFIGRQVMAYVPLCPKRVRRDGYSDQCNKLAGAFRSLYDFADKFTAETWNALLDAHPNPPWYLVCDEDGKLVPEDPRKGQFRMPKAKTVVQEDAAGDYGDQD